METINRELKEEKGTQGGGRKLQTQTNKQFVDLLVISSPEQQDAAHLFNRNTKEQNVP